MQRPADAARFLTAPEPPDPPHALVDSHVHIFPPRVFAAVWRWFEQHAWPIRYRLEAEAVCAFLERRGVQRFWGLHYSHVPEMARSLNVFAAELAAKCPALVPFGTVLPGEHEAAAIVAEALDDFDLAGIKIHCHVQQCAPDDVRLFPICEALIERGRALVMHAGREPAFEEYGFDCRTACGFEPVRRLVTRFPELKLVVPHLGQDQWREFLALCRDAPNLYLDTAMAVGGYLTEDRPTRDDLLPVANRVMFGTDFPNLPYPWAMERDWLIGLGLPDAALHAILSGNADRLVRRRSEVDS
jgi:predicted TIM-barrel fold metal-dependent hydrolase